MTDVNIPGIKRDDDTMPVLGLGTWESDGVMGRHAVRTAIMRGYRHIDTAQMYENEDEVGQAIKESGVERSELFVTTKLAPGNMTAPRIRESFAKSLEQLLTDYVDLLLIHWPDDSVPLEETLGTMAELRDSGVAKHIGVSNFPTDWLQKAIDAVDAPIFCDQVEYHARLDQSVLLSFCRDRGIPLVAYSPLGRGELARDKRLEEIGQRHGKTAAQVALRWLIRQPGVAAIPKGTSDEHVTDNLDIFDFDLSEEEVALIDSIEKDQRVVDPQWAPRWDG